MELKTVKFRAFGQKVGGTSNKFFICFVIDDGDFNECEFPNLFTIDGAILPPTIYTGTYPQIKFNPTTIVDRDDLKGAGIAGIITDECVFARQESLDRDDLGLSIAQPKVY